LKILLKADWIITRELEEIKDGYAVIKDGKILSYERRKPEADYFELELELKGILYPPFVNAHTHLELSGIDFSPEKIEDFISWLRWIVKKVRSLKREELREAVERGLRESLAGGAAFVGDISSFGVSPEVLKDKGVVFREFIGKEPPRNFPTPLSIHSIYSVSADAIRELVRRSLDRGSPYQIHVAESVEEVKFARCERNRFEEEIYPFLGRERYERLCAEGVVDYLKRVGALTEKLIAVHITNLNEKEIDELTERGAGVVLCPRSNVHLKVGFPSVARLMGYEKLSLGTDGRSSNLSLSIVSELKALYYALRGEVSLRRLFPLITTNGAKVLEIGDYWERAIFTFLKCDRAYPDPFAPLLLDEVEFEILDFSSTPVI